MALCVVLRGALLLIRLITGVCVVWITWFTLFGVLFAVLIAVGGLVWFAVVCLCFSWLVTFTCG